MNNLLFFWLNIAMSIFPKPAEPAFPEMVLVRGGYFHQGDSLGNADEKPVRQIRLSDFFMAKTELNPNHCRITNRSSRFPDGRDCNLGFRVARNAQ